MAIGLGGCGDEVVASEWAETAYVSPQPQRRAALAAARHAQVSLRERPLLSVVPPAVRQEWQSVFGGPGWAAAGDFVAARIHHLFHISELEGVYPGGLWSLADLRGYMTPLVPVADSALPVRASATLVTPAVNLGPTLFYTNRDPRDPAMIKASGEIVPIRSPSEGVVVITDDFICAKDASTSPALGLLRQQVMLIHEARHSDCPNGPAGYATHTCGYLHGPCPEGTFTGQFVCDLTLYGAYHLQLLAYDAALVSHRSPDGTPLTPRDLDLLKALRIDAKARIFF